MLAMITLIGLFSALLLILQSYTFSLILDRVFLLARSLPQVWHLMLLFLGLLLARACLTWTREIAATRLAYRLKMHVRQQLLAHLFALGPIPLTEERRGELMSTLVDGVDAIGPYFSDYLPQRLLAALVPALVLVISVLGGRAIWPDVAGDGPNIALSSRYGRHHDQSGDSTTLALSTLDECSFP